MPPAKPHKPATPRKPAKSDAPADRDALVRQAAGTYRTGDDRFEVRDAGTGWYLVDSQRTDELGQELLIGPFPTLKAVRDELPKARAAR
jgi:hypothetical protein